MRICLPCLVLLAWASSGEGQWEQFGGPQRNFHCPAENLAPSWPEKGPPVEWRREIGDGYAGILVDGERLYTMTRRAGTRRAGTRRAGTRPGGTRQDGVEVVIALDRATGKTVWEHAYRVDITPSAREYGGGPASTPALSGSRLVTIGVGMNLCCFDKGTGEVLWQRNLMEEHELPMPGRGYSSSPLVYEDTVILQLGGPDPVNAEDDAPSRGVRNGAITAFDLATGKVAWSGHNFPESKASPILIEFGDRPQLVVFTGNELAGLDPENGTLLWLHEHATSYGFNCATPVYDGVDTLVCSSAYNNWTEAVQLVEKDGAIEANLRWASRRLKVHFTNLLLVGGRVYGSNGMGRPAFVSCLDLETGSARWRKRGFAKANFLYADGRFVILDEDGRLALASFSDDGIEVHGSLTVTEGYAFSAPTLVGTKLYLRDRKMLTVFDLGAEAVARHAARKDDVGRFALAQPALPKGIEHRLGDYAPESSGASARASQRVRLLVEDGWLCVKFFRQAPLRLAPAEEGRLWEVIADRTSGSTPRSIEFLSGKDGAKGSFVLNAPGRKSTYILLEE